MKVMLRRHGIVIRTIENLKSPSRIGSGEECEIRIDDPYLAAHVGDLLERDGQWHIVDAASSMEGITHNGRRIEDEIVAPDQPYSIGGFEMVVEGAARPRQATLPGREEAPTLPGVPNPRAAAPTVPGTVVEDISEMRRSAGTPRAAVPVTVFEDISSMRSPSTVAAPMVRPALSVSPIPQTNQQAPPPPSKGRSLGVVIVALGAVLLLLVLVGVALLRRPAAPAPVTASVPAPIPTVTAPPPPAPLTDEALAKKLDVDHLLDRWEQKLATAPDPELQRRFTRAAVDMGLAHAAAHDDAGAKPYFERAVKVGDPASDAVKVAKARLGTGTAR
jgi:hypothetical protein